MHPSSNRALFFRFQRGNFMHLIQYFIHPIETPTNAKTYASDVYETYFATSGILRPKPKAFELIRKIGGV